MFYAIDPEQQRIEATPKATALCPACGDDVRAKCGKVVTWHWAHVEKECDSFSEPMTAWHREWQETVPEDCREVVIGPHRADILSPLGIVVELQHSSISVDEIREREEFYGQMIWVFDAREASNLEDVTEARRTNAQLQQRKRELLTQHESCPVCSVAARDEIASKPWYPAELAQQPGWVESLLGVSDVRQSIVFRNAFQELAERHIACVLRSEGLVFRDPSRRLTVSTRTRDDGLVHYNWKHPRRSIEACERTVYLDLGANQLLRLQRNNPYGGWGQLMQKTEFVHLINAGRSA